MCLCIDNNGLFVGLLGEIANPEEWLKGVFTNVAKPWVQDNEWQDPNTTPCPNCFKISNDLTVNCKTLSKMEYSIGFWYVATYCVTQLEWKQSNWSEFDW